MVDNWHRTLHSLDPRPFWLAWPEMSGVQTAVVVVMDVAETKSQHRKAISLLLARLKLLILYFSYSFHFSAKFYTATTFSSNDTEGGHLVDVHSVGYHLLY